MKIIYFFSLICHIFNCVYHFVCPFLAIILASDARAANDVDFNYNVHDGDFEVADLAGSFQYDFDLSAEGCYDSPTIELNNLNWTLKMRLLKPGFQLELSASPSVKTPYWTCEADARIKMVIVSPTRDFVHEINLDNLTFSNVYWVRSKTHKKSMELSKLNCQQLHWIHIHHYQHRAQGLFEPMKNFTSN